MDLWRARMYSSAGNRLRMKSNTHLLSNGNGGSDDVGGRLVHVLVGLLSAHVQRVRAVGQHVLVAQRVPRPERVQTHSECDGADLEGRERNARELHQLLPRQVLVMVVRLVGPLDVGLHHLVALRIQNRKRIEDLYMYLSVSKYRCCVLPGGCASAPRGTLDHYSCTLADKRS